MRYREGLYWVVIIATVIAALLLYRHNRNLQAIHQRLRTEKEIADLRKRADEYFIAGQLDSSLVLYEKVDMLTGDSLTHRRRRQFAPPPDTSAYYEKINLLFAQLSHTKAALSACKSTIATLIGTIRKDTAPVSVPSCPEVPFLQSKLDSLHLLIDTLKKRGFLEFYSSKGGHKITYFGEIADGMANGYGIGYWSSGSIYKGYWKNNMRHGKGIFEWADGERYEGEYREDKRHGYGVYISKVGRYEGYWEGDMRHGEGKLYEANGKLRVHGIWEYDKLEKILK